jgi:hypothetical protein
MLVIVNLLARSSHILPAVLVLAIALSASARPSFAEVTAEKSADKVTIKIDGDLFCEYVTDSNGKPIVWPIIGPGGTKMTRDYPMERAPGEQRDHPHQRSFWFTHGDVNGVDFWMEGPKAGKQKHREFVNVESGERAIVVTRNDWIGPDGKKLLQDERRVAFFPNGESRVIDFDIQLTASEGPVVFGDTKEGSFGLRIVESMRVTQPKNAKEPGKGHILNSEGQTNGATWGKRASWVAYSGPVKDAHGAEQLAGITIINHPSSFRFPTHWHVRDYGLFAANPFGIHDFENKERGAGNHTLEAGQSMSLRYRVIFHKGAPREPELQKAFAEYAGDGKQAAAR